MDDFFNTVMAALAEPRRGLDKYKKYLVDMLNPYLPKLSLP